MNRSRLLAAAVIAAAGISTSAWSQCNVPHTFDAFHVIIPAVDRSIHPQVGFPTHVALTFLNPTLTPATVSVASECHQASQVDPSPCATWGVPFDADQCGGIVFNLNNPFQERTAEITLCPGNANTWIYATYLFSSASQTAVQAEATLVYDVSPVVQPRLSMNHMQLVRDSCR